MNYVTTLSPIGENERFVFSRRSLLRWTPRALVAFAGGVGLPVAASALTAPREIPAASLAACYSEWLFRERQALAREMYPTFDEAERFVPVNFLPYRHLLGLQDSSSRPSARAGLVLAAAGVDLDEAEAAFIRHPLPSAVAS